jgi:hypothetical protein
MTYNLHTDAGDKINGKIYVDRETMLEAVRELYGESCDFGITEGTILDGGENLIATFGQN